MDSTISSIVKPHAQNHFDSNYDIESTNAIIENLIADEKKRARDLLNKNISIYQQLIKHGVDTGAMSIEDFLNICNDNGMKLVQKEINDKLIYSYDDKVKQFLK